MIYFNPRLRSNYLRFRKTDGCHIRILFPVSILPTYSHLSARSNRTIVGGVITPCLFFKMAAGSHIGFDLGNVSPPAKCNCRSQLGSQIWSWSDLYFWRHCDFYILPFFLEIAYSRPFWGEGLGYIPPNVITHRFNPQRSILAQKHVVLASVKIGPAVRPGRNNEKKVMTGQYSQKSHTVVIFHLFEKKPHCTD